MGWTVIKDGKRLCITCKGMMPTSEFAAYAYWTKQRKRKRRHNSRCKTCESVRRADRYARDGHITRAEAREYKNKNKGILNEKVRIYRTNNAEIVRLQRRSSEAKRKDSRCGSGANGLVYKRVLDEARLGDLWLDAYSGCLISEPTIDHIVPLSRGGRHEYDNLCVTSLANNSSKHNRPLLIWMVER